MKVGKTPFVLGFLFAASVALSTVHPLGNPHKDVQPGAPVLQGAEAPEQVRVTLEQKCGDCHSESTRYPLYSHMAPLSWMIDQDVSKGRESLDISRWQFYNTEDRINALTRMASEVHAGTMPPRPYVLLHSKARLSPDEQKLIYAWAKSERKQLRSISITGSDQFPIDSRTQRP